MKKAYLIKNIEEYGKLISYCINHDVTVWRTYWDEKEKGDRCYVIDCSNKRCFYSSKKYWEAEGYEIIVPNFVLDEYGNNYKIDHPTEKGGEQ